MDNKETAKMMLRNEKVGSPISDKLSTYLRAYTDKSDVVEVNRKTGISPSTIIDVRRQANNLTESNSEAMAELIKIAIVRCGEEIQAAKKAARDLKKALV